MKQTANEATNELVEAIFNDKYYSEIKLANKSIIVKICYARDCVATFEYCYNSISGGYMGLQCKAFVDSIRGLLRVCPDFFEEIECSEYRRGLKKLGFECIPATDADIKLYQLLNK